MTSFSLERRVEALERKYLIMYHRFYFAHRRKERKINSEDKKRAKLNASISRWMRVLNREGRGLQAIAQLGRRLKEDRRLLTLSAAQYTKLHDWLSEPACRRCGKPR